MKRLSILVLLCMVMACSASADNKKKRRTSVTPADSTLNASPTDGVAMQSIKPVSIADSLQEEGDRWLRQLAQYDTVATPHLDALMERLMTDTITKRQDVMLRLCRKILSDTKGLHWNSDSTKRRLAAYVEAADMMIQVNEILAAPFNAERLAWADERLKALLQQQLTATTKERVEVQAKGVKYYKNKMALRRVGDIIDELYEMKADTTLAADSIPSQRTDSLFAEIVEHEGRNHLIAYVPYADGLRRKVVDAFVRDERGLLWKETQWQVVEAVRKEIEDVLGK